MILPFALRGSGAARHPMLSGTLVVGQSLRAVALQRGRVGGAKAERAQRTFTRSLSRKAIPWRQVNKSLLPASEDGFKLEARHLR